MATNDMPPSPLEPKKAWWRELTRYHWFVLIVAALGWLFDCLDQQLFILARPAAMRDLISGTPEMTPAELDLSRRNYADLATSIFIAGWAMGGLIFGMLGDRIGRAKTMVITILMYSLFTGLSSFSVGFWDFAFYRFLTGLGVGGEFAVGVALVAEVMPDRARAGSLSALQALSAFGNVAAAMINLGLGVAEEKGLVTSPWRTMFLIGAAPALLALVVRWKLKEPEKWKKASHDDVVKKKLGSYRELFSDPTLRKHALLGLLLGCSGIIGLWTVGFFTPDLIGYVQRKSVTEIVFTEQLDAARQANDAAQIARLEQVRAAVEDARLTDTFDDATKEVKKSVDGAINGRLSAWRSYVSLAINFGAFLGMFGFGYLAQRIGRKKTFVVGLLSAFFSTIAVFLFLQEMWQVWVMVPLMGFCQLSLFAGYAIYFPELFPTRLRSTGTSFCYNVGRFLAALGPIMKAGLERLFMDPNAEDKLEAVRFAGATMCCVFLIGLFVLPFLPETHGKPLPE